MSTFRTRRVSANDHPVNKYLRGYDWWSANQFWEDDDHTEKSKEYFRALLEAMRNEEYGQTLHKAA